MSFGISLIRLWDDRKAIPFFGVPDEQLLCSHKQALSFIFAPESVPV